jgi:hypothetical protein
MAGSMTAGCPEAMSPTPAWRATTTLACSTRPWPKPSRGSSSPVPASRPPGGPGRRRETAHPLRAPAGPAAAAPRRTPGPPPRAPGAGSPRRRVRLRSGGRGVREAAKQVPPTRRKSGCSGEPSLHTIDHTIRLPHLQPAGPRTGHRARQRARTRLAADPANDGARGPVMQR